MIFMMNEVKNFQTKFPNFVVVSAKQLTGTNENESGITSVSMVINIRR